MSENSILAIIISNGRCIIFMFANVALFSMVEQFVDLT
mgnify:CR=1 FL=1